MYLAKRFIFTCDHSVTTHQYMIDGKYVDNVEDDEQTRIQDKDVSKVYIACRVLVNGNQVVLSVQEES